MAELAAAGDRRLSVSAVEVEAAGPSYTHETLERLAGERPGDDLALILGADQARDFAGWRDPRRVLELAGLAVADRAQIRREEVLAALDRVDGRERAEFFEMPELAISSTMVRERVGRGQPIRHLVPGPVIELIEREGLYR